MLGTGFAAAEPQVRVAFYHTELFRDGPGLLLRDIERGSDAQVAAVVRVIADTKPDVIALLGIDWDLEGRALTALAKRLAEAGHPMPHAFAGPSNRGRPTGFDLDSDGRPGEPEDAQGFGDFTGQGGLAVLSRHPIARSQIRDFSDMLWRDLPDAMMPWPGAPEGVEDVLRLSSTSHWLVPIETGAQGRLWLGTFAAQTPVFDGPEDRNGRRNHDEVRFWSLLLDGAFGPAPDGLLIVGDANLDPERGAGRRAAITALLSDPRLSDPAPRGAAGTLTVDWRRGDLENMRVSYVLPDQSWEVVASGVVWPEPGTPEAATADAASRHRLVWADLVRR